MTRSKKGAHRGGKQRDDTYRTDRVTKSEMQNEQMTAYYKAQNIIPEEEWEEFMDALREPLPTTFRVAGSREIAHALNDSIKNSYVPALGNIIFEEETVSPPVQIPWYPEGLAWQFNVSKKVLRKSPEFKKFHSFLVFETEVGNISRQEAVSMLPPLFLEVEPHHRVLDMCAAPGSKTAQLLEALHAQDTVTALSIPSGLLIANDSDHKRTHLLIHQSARLPSPALMVTNLDASIYPIIKIPSEKPLTPVKAKWQEQLLFDRILCDVPCSGDGTMRKNLGIWKRWQPMDGNGLHGLQLRILQRAMRMLNAGGRIVYSTCSMNPVENEAVLAAALKTNPEFELVDVSSNFPHLTRRPGLTFWKPTVDRKIDTSFASFQDYEKTLSGSAKSDTKMTEMHWPPADAQELGLTRCLRIYPHLQDTGGFFIAVLERRASPASSNDRAELKREAEESLDDPETKKPRISDDALVKNELATSDVAMTDTDEVARLEKNKGAPKPATGSVHKGKGKKKSDESGGVFRENPYTFLKPDDPTLITCIERLNLTSDFPSSNVLVRNPEGDAVRSLYLTNDIVKSIVKYNDYTRIRLMTCGTKVFTKQEPGKGLDSQFRVLGEGLPVILPFTNSESIIPADLASLKTLIEVYYPLCISFTDPFKSLIEAKPSGGHIARFPAGSVGGVTLTHDLVLPLWKSNVSISLMIDKKAKSALSLRLYGEDITTAGRDKNAAQTKKLVALEQEQPEHENDVPEEVINELEDGNNT